MKNIQPQSPSIVSVTLLGAKARVVHSSLVDYDAQSVACFLYAVTKGTSDYRNSNSYESVLLIGKGDVNFFDLPVPTIDDTQEYVIEIAVVDELVGGATVAGSSIQRITYEGDLLNTVSNPLITEQVSTAIVLSSATRFNKVRGAYLTDVIVNIPDSVTNSAPPFLTFNVVAENIENTNISSMTIDYSTGYDGSSLNSLTWDSMYTGPYQGTISGSAGLTIGETYVFRTVTYFADGTTSTEYYDSDVNTTNLEHPLVETVFSGSLITPPDFSALNFEAFTSWDGTATYELKLSWVWGGTDTGSVRHFEVQQLRRDTLADGTNSANLDWTDAIDYIAAPSSTNLYIPAIPLGIKYIFRIRAVGWGSEETKYSDWLYGKVVLGNVDNVSFDIIPNNSTPPINTNIQVTDQAISAYKDWGLGTQFRTFHVDANTGNVSIGGDKLIFDAVNGNLSVEGSAIINDITAASFVMDWVGGTAPSLRTATKSDYAMGGSGMWAGYTDNTTFKFDLGDDTGFIRWDGENLEISGGVTITLPNDVSSLPPGALGYTTLAVSATNNIVLFNGENNSLKESPTTINLNANSNGDSTFISKLVWEVLDSDSNDVTSQLLSEQYTNAPENSKKLTISTANGGLSAYNNLTVRVYYKPGSENWSTANIKDLTNIGKVKTYDDIVGLEEPFYAYLTNESQPIPVDAESKNPYLADATGDMKIYQGTTDLSNSPNTSYTVVNADGCSVSLSGNTYTVTAIPLSSGVPTKDTYAVTIRATYISDGTPITYDRVFSLYISKQGAKGDPGSQGDPGPKGDDGTTLYTWLKYASSLYSWQGNSSWDTSNDTGITFEFESSGAKDCVLRLLLTDAEGDISVDLNGNTVLSNLSGPNNAQVWFNANISVPAGTNVIRVYNPSSATADGGQVKQIHVISDLTNDPSGQEFLGISYSNTSIIESENIHDYQWAKVVGDKGDTGEPGPIGDDGQSLYTWIKYSANSNGNPMTDAPASNTQYIGLAYNKEVAAESNDYTLYSWYKWKGEKGDAGNPGVQGRRAPMFLEASTTQNPNNSSVWSGGTSSHAYAKLIELAGDAVAYDMLTLYNQNTPSQTDTKMWNGSAWESAVKINGNIIADGTIGAKAIVADEGFFEDISVNRIYNHGGSSGNYKMMIDFQNGAIHIRGGN